MQAIPEQAPSPAPAQLLAELHKHLPQARLTISALPQCPTLRLWLINADFPQWQLDHDQAQAIMNDPPFWSFCWASGQVLAAHFLQYPELVRGKSIVDFGAGSGVVAIACMLAGARRAVVCDNDPLALLACRANAELNGVVLDYSSSIDETEAADIVTVADVFYDRDNLPLLTQLRQQYLSVWVADSRLKGQPLAGLKIVHRASSYTVPDLDESSEFNSVCLYTSTATGEARTGGQ